MHQNHYREVANCIAAAFISAGAITQIVNLTSYPLHRGPDGRMWSIAWILVMLGGLLLPRRFATGLLAGFALAMALPTTFNQLIWFLK